MDKARTTVTQQPDEAKGVWTESCRDDTIMLRLSKVLILFQHRMFKTIRYPYLIVLKVLDRRTMC